MLRITSHILEIEDEKGRNMFLIKMFGDLILELFRRTGNNILLKCSKKEHFSVIFYTFPVKLEEKF
jgi:hypothetical protein